MEGRGLTLRSKTRRQRPQISAPKPISGPLPTSSKPSSSSGGAGNATPHTSRERSPQNASTVDLVKRRYSARFNQIPEIDAPPVPSLPAAAGGHGGLNPSSENRNPSSDILQPIEVDFKALKDPSLPVERYVANLLVDASEEDIREYQKQLRKLKNRTSTDLQQNVYKNRTQFIKISKEAEKLKGEMRTLRALMAELTTALGETAGANTPNPMLPAPDDYHPKRNANRSSIANLESMWNIQLQTLWKTVEGSQKFLPAVPGRHIVMETGHWVELDSATWKPRRPIHIVLLNDHLLIAAKKRRRIDQTSPNSRGPVPTKLVAEECWSPQDIDMIDLSANLDTDAARQEAEGRGIANAITIRVGNQQFTYRHDKPHSSAKSELLSAFRKTVEDLRRTLRSEAETVGRSNDALAYLNRVPSKQQADDSLEFLRDKNEVRIDVDGKQQNLRWIEGQIDELDVEIALQRFEEAVSSIERLRKLAKGLRNNTLAQNLINAKVDQRAAKLADALIRDLVDTHSFPMATKSKVTWLSRLGLEDSARQVYLQARSDIIAKRIRQCIFEGNLPLYIFQISFIYFTLVKNTIGIYQQCFPTFMTSACIKWAKEHLDTFNSLLTRQLSSVERGTSIWRKCLDVVHEQAGLLVEVGVDFDDLVARGLGDRIERTGEYTDVIAEDEGRSAAQ